MHKTGSYIIRLWSIHEYIPNKIILGTLSYRRLKTSSRDSKENIDKRKDRQLVGQSSSIQFLSIKVGSVNKKVTFDTHDNLEERILTAQDHGQNKQFKPKMYKIKRRGQTKKFYDRQNRNFQKRYILNSGRRRISFSGGMQYRQNYRDRPRYDQNYRNNFRRGNFRENRR